MKNTIAWFALAVVLLNTLPVGATAVAHLDPASTALDGKAARSIRLDDIRRDGTSFLPENRCQRWVDACPLLTDDPKEVWRGFIEV